MLLSTMIERLQEVEENIGEVEVHIGPQVSPESDKTVERIYSTLDWEGFRCVIVE